MNPSPLRVHGSIRGVDDDDTQVLQACTMERGLPGCVVKQQCNNATMRASVCSLIAL